MKKLPSFAMLSLLISVMLLAATPRPGAQTPAAPPATPSPAATPEAAAAAYTPKADFCADGSSNLCSKLAAYIFEPNPQLQKGGLGYNGLFGPPPTNPSQDLQTHFDNLSWQMFVALNWAANSVSQPAATGLTQPGPRVWQKYPKVSALFGNSKVRAGCTQALALPAFYIGSYGDGRPAPNNEEYLQASTNRPLIDVNGNWTIFERRVNDIEAKYLLKPGGQASQTLTTIAGQKLFIQYNKTGGVQFTSSTTVPDGPNGSIEIKASWRILDRAAGDDPSRYFTQQVFIAVAGDLVSNHRPFCRTETVGLVGMHILQRNPVDPKNIRLLPEWFWASFEHVDNAPLAQTPCNVRNGCGTNSATNWINKVSCGPGTVVPPTHYSFFNPNLPSQTSNVIPQPPGGTSTTKYPWNPQRPYAKGGTSAATAVPQVVRCFEIYPTTASLNGQWQTALGNLSSVFANYMLIGSQWGGDVETPAPPNPIPGIGVPGMLSNTTLETYIQNNTGKGNAPGSCVACHTGAKLPEDKKTSSNFSFLPLMAKPATARSQIQTAE